MCLARVTAVVVEEWNSQSVTLPLVEKIIWQCSDRSVVNITWKYSGNNGNCTEVCSSVCVCVFMGVCVCGCVCVCVCVCVGGWVCMHARVHVCLCNDHMGQEFKVLKPKYCT